jgi:2-polyprenyl-6-methoxyphenol hydroxylase-like FAD-dependent oxidoreductase
MPPQGESIGLALEDALLFARVLAKFHTQGLEPAFSVYENLRRQKVEDAHREASKRWENVRDSGYLVMKLKEIVFPAIFWWTKSSREKAYLYDTETIDIPELIGEERQDC